MTTITKERIELFIKNPLENGLTRGEQMDLARIVLASLDAEPVLYAAEETLAYAKMGELHLTCLSEPMGDAVTPLYTAPPAPAVIQSSQLLHDFYRAYADWLICGGDGQFSCVNGLCANLFDYCDRKGVGSAQALNEMHVQFVTAGMNEKLPFNTSVTDFDAESADGKCHLNTARRKWVFRRIIDGVKPVPVVPDEMATSDDMNLYQKSFAQGYNACRAAMLNGGKS